MADNTNDRSRQRLSQSTIVAIATPPGRGGVGILRLSGPDAISIASKVAGPAPVARMAAYRRFRDTSRHIIDDGLFLVFPAPNSFTGEDVVELQCHGSPVALDMLQQLCLDLGAELAAPGEFSERAFLNGRIDLVQAEAIADLIDSRTRSAARSAQRSLQGEFSRRVNNLRDRLVDLRKYVEAAIDFTDEDIDFLNTHDLPAKLAEIMRDVDELLAQAENGRLLHDGITIVLAGPPNAGKSSLLNCLAHMDAAIVSSVPGTTRDVIRESISIDGLPITLLDTAGLRLANDEIESEGIRRAQKAMETADHVLLLTEDGTSEDDVNILISQLADPARATLVLNKIDISGRNPGTHHFRGITAIALSVQTGSGISELKQRIRSLFHTDEIGEATFIARRRHIDALNRARSSTNNAKVQLQAGMGDLMAEDLRQAQNALAEITGEFVADDLLGEIFSSFCIGK
ncbi:MAG: tRNA uridine-5-carboxymethylaminomethyl(34) synthesis GTPase MnmE [Gammaproteobacteria bacterium]|nr:tRNA uridine-5-carboxymethylaminomethyl(34) synthesis GTPase MnmE [Gammaproteobacteria bacterium]